LQEVKYSKIISKNHFAMKMIFETFMNC